jgi:hypothetical protein
MFPLLPFGLAAPKPNGEGGEQPWHSTPYQALPSVHVQNASLEVAWSRTVDELGSIAGREVMPWLTESYDGFDLNHETDWLLLERLLDLGLVSLEEPTAVPAGTPIDAER